jgi:hypothetical protein
MYFLSLLFCNAGKMHSLRISSNKEGINQSKSMVAKHILELLKRMRHAGDLKKQRYSLANLISEIVVPNFYLFPSNSSVFHAIVFFNTPQTG